MFQGQLRDLTASGRHFRPSEELEDASNSVLSQCEQQEEQLQRVTEWKRVEAHPKNN